MNAKIVGGVLGGVALLIAGVMVCIALSAAMDAGIARQQVDQVNTGWTKVVNDMSGASQVAENQIGGVETKAAVFGVGALLMGGAGVVFIAGGFLIGKRA
ncbi:MAG TPA: hypothetical protein VHC22_11885 [Pirellulales bacterium]|nr:hypothetical protein [Pirellulales bacterium]